MSRFVILVSLLVAGIARAAPLPPPTDSLRQIPFPQLAQGKLLGAHVLGISGDGKRYAYVDAEIADGSGFLSVNAAIVELATGKVAASWKLGGQHEAGDKAVLAQGKKYEAFLAKARIDGIRFDPAATWKKQPGKVVSPDGKLALRWRAGRPRGGEVEEDPHGRTFTAMLEDPDTQDHAALFELFAGRGADQVTRKDAPAFGEVYGSGDGFVVTIVSRGQMMCWDADDTYVQGYSLAALRVLRPARELNNAGMIAYRSNQLEDAQAIFRSATVIDPRGARARYNLAAISAKRADDDTALAALAVLAKGNLPLLRWKLATDEDFAAAHTRKKFAAAIEKLGITRP